MDKLNRVTGKIINVLGVPLAVLVLLEVFWPGDTPLWIGMAMLPILLIGAPTVFIFLFTGIALLDRHRRAKRES